MTHRGMLSSLEFRPSPRVLEGEISVELLELRSDDPGAATEVDAEEHGPLQG